MSSNEQTLKSRLETAKAALDTPRNGCVILLNGQPLGTLTLSGSNTYSGATTISAGTLPLPEALQKEAVATATNNTPVRPS